MRPFADKARWPIEPAALAALIDMGLSDRLIAEYFGVDCSDIRALRQRYGLLDGRQPTTKREASDDPDEAILCRLHQLAERLSASGNYVESLRLRLCKSGPLGVTEILEKATRQIRGAIEEFHGLRDHLAKSPHLTGAERSTTRNPPPRSKNTELPR